MSRKKILLTTFLMALALLGIVAMQVSWIRKDYRLQEEKFSHQVTDAINAAIRKLETRESVRMIVRNAGENFMDDSLKQFFRESEFPETLEPPEPPADIEPVVLAVPELPEEVHSYSFITGFDSGSDQQLQVFSHQSGTREEISFVL